jgi:hypothetical protein
MPKKAVAQAFSFMGPFNQARKIGDDVLPHFGKAPAGNHAKMGMESGEGIGADSGMGPGNATKKSRLPRIGKAQKTNLGHDLEFETKGDLHGRFSRLGKVGSLSGGSREMDIAPTSPSTGSRHEKLAFGHDVGQQISCLGIKNLCPQRDEKDKVLPVLSVLLLPATVFAGGGNNPGSVLEVEERRTIRRPAKDDGAPVSSISPIRTSTRNELLPPEGGRTIPAFSRGNAEGHLINKLGHGASGRVDAETSPDPEAGRRIRT